jgi:hypothetical protein
MREAELEVIAWAAILAMGAEVITAAGINIKIFGLLIALLLFGQTVAADALSFRQHWPRHYCDCGCDCDDDD